MNVSDQMGKNRSLRRNQERFSKLEVLAIIWGVLVASLCWLPYLLSHYLPIRSSGIFFGALLLGSIGFVFIKKWWNWSLS